MRRSIALLAALAIAAGACGDDDDDSPATTSTSASTTATTAPPTSSSVSRDALALTLFEVAQVDEPVAIAFTPGPNRPDFNVATKGGEVYYVPGPRESPELRLDISDEVSTGNEQGLLDLAASPDGDRLFISYTNEDGDTRIEVLDAQTYERRGVVFELDQPYGNHNGGNIVFGPDGMLWFGLGDGGAGGDPDDRAQDPDELLGKLLRFDPATWEPSIYALGARNPWRFSFDRETGDLWIGDVGQSAWEEIDLVRAGTAAGVNLGWNLLEGSHPFEADDAPGSLLPVYEYGREQGQSVVGGYVYRGSRIPALVGTYVFADTYTGVLWALRPDGVAYAFDDLGIEVPGGLVSSFGEDGDGELYVMSLAGGVYRIDAA